MENKWTDIFALSQFEIWKRGLSYSNRTVRIIIRNYYQGEKVAITLGNTFGKQPYEVEAATLAACNQEGKLQGQATVLAFGGKGSVTVQGGSQIQSDALVADISPGYYAVSLYFGKNAHINSLNMLREKVLLSVKGDYTLAPTFNLGKKLTFSLIKTAFKILKVQACDFIPALAGVSIYTKAENKCIIAFGDSITQGGLWTYRLADRLSAPVLNMSISGNRIIYDAYKLPLINKMFGISGSSRFAQDVLAKNNAAALIIALGTNDIGAPGSPSAPKSQSVSAEQIITELEAMVIQAKKAGLAVFACTLTPFKGYRMGYMPGSREKMLQVNDWIRTYSGLDGYFDFDASIGDKADAERIAACYDSIDHLHPSDIGSLKMADDIDISCLEKLLSK